MIKAKKGLLIALFAAMMVFAFGATSAFAQTSDVGYDDPGTAAAWDWSDDFTTADYDGEQATVKWTFGGSDGLTTATATYTEYVGTNEYTRTSVRRFYDFTGAYIDMASPMSLAYYTGLNTKAAAVTVVKPAKAKLNKGCDDEEVVQFTKPLADDVNGWYATYATDQYAIAGTDAEIEVEMDAADTTGYNGKNHAPIFGNAPKLAVKISGEATTDSIHWYEVVDGKAVPANDELTTKHSEDFTAAINVPYDGNTHTLFAPYVAKATITYQKWNPSAAKWEAAEGVTYDAVADIVTYRAKYQKTDSEGNVTSFYGTLYLTVTGTTAEPTYRWTEGNGYVSPTSGATYDYVLTPEMAADPTALIEFANGFSKTGNPIGNVDADMDTVKAYFADRYDIVITANKIDSSLQDWTIEPKEFAANDKKAFQKKYETFIKTYTLQNGDPKLLRNAWREGTWRPSYRYTVTVKVDGQTLLKDDDINFTEAPNVTYKAKKLKKKAKSFTVAAVADSGNAVSYKIDSPSKKITCDASGKITVAKKLKKGTYKVTVKASTTGGNGYKAAKAERVITIKVKK